MPSLKPHSASSVPASSKGTNPSQDGPIPVDRFLTFFSVAIFGCAADLLTKHWVFQWRGLPRADNEWWIWEPYFGIETAVNTGALFGMGGGHGRVFAALSILAGVGIVFWLFYFRAARDRWLTVALACVMAGILGNLYDRLGLWVEPNMPPAWGSAVRDWILLRYGNYTWPNFNIADSMLVCGAMMLMWHAFREQKSVEQNAKVSPV
jgi:signal peptidase II